MIEYLLLMGVVMTLAVAVLNSKAFKKIIGPNSDLFEKMRLYMEYSYRHGSAGYESQDDYFGKHDTYYNSKKKTTRFFGPKSKYPR